jgi:DNA repair exonuclease SbcCD ATPase subunit
MTTTSKTWWLNVFTNIIIDDDACFIIMNAQDEHARNGHIMDKWFFIADLHLEGARLDTIQPSLDWLLSEHRRRRPRHVFFLGDVTNCRRGDVRGLHALKRLVDALVGGDFDCNVHCVVGNHCSFSLDSREESSPVLVAHDKAHIFAYTEVTKRYIDGIPVVLLPWFENAAELLPHLEKYATAPDAAETVVLGHLALRGARMTGYSFGGTTAILDDTAILTKDHFSAFRWAFAGHFHDPAVYGNFCYVGSFDQINFGDAHITRRGYVLYQPSNGHWELKTNPHAVHFVDVTPEDVLSGALDAGKLKDKSVRLIAADGTTLHQENEARAALTQCDITSLKVVRRTRPRPAPSEHAPAEDSERPVENQREFLARMVDRFVSECVPEQQRADASAYISRVISATVSDTGKTLFHADVAKVTAKDFLGFRGTTTLNFDALARGVWMMTGENGSGKSQMLDAIAWCLFKETFRWVSKDEVVNNEAAAGAQCAVTVTFANGTVVHRTMKTLKVTRPNGEAVQKGSMKHTQEILEREILNTDWDTFRRAVLLDSNDFLSLFSGGDKHRNTVLERLLGMEVLDTMWKAVEADAAASAEKEAELSKQLMEITPRLTLAAQGMEEAHRRIQEESVTLRNTEAGLMNEQASARTDEEEEKAGKERILQLRERLQAAQTAVDDLAPAVQEAIEKRADAAAELSAAEHEDVRVMRECEALEDKLAAAQDKVAALVRDRAQAEAELASAEGTRQYSKEQMEEHEGQGQPLRASLSDRQRALDEARTALSDHQAETIRLRDELSREELAEIVDLTEERKEVVAARNAQRKVLQADQERRKRLHRALSKREEASRASAGEKQARAAVYRARLKAFEEGQREADKFRELVRRRKERMALPRIIDRALFHAQSSGSEAIIKGIREDVVEPLREMSAAVGDLTGSLTGDDEDRLDQLTEELKALRIGGDPTHAELVALEETAAGAQDAWRAALKASSDMSAATEVTTSSLDAEVDMMDGRLEELRARVDAAASRFQTARQEEGGSLKATLLSRQGEKRDAAQAVAEWEVREEALRVALQEVEVLCTQLSARVASCKMELVAAEGTAADLRDRLRAANERRPAQEALLGLRKRAEGAGEELDVIRAQEDAARKDQSRATVEMDEAEGALASLKTRAMKRSETIGRLSADMSHAREALDRLVLERERKRGEHEELQKIHDELREALSHAEGEHDTRKLWKNALASANDTSSAKSKTVTQQKGAFRRLCRSAHLSFLQSRFDENLAALNGGHWDSRLASTLTENFQFNKRDGESVAFNQRSSGERQKTVLALLVAIVESLITHGSMRPMFLACDEVG